MKYIITNIDKAIEIGINPVGHLKKDGSIILNQNEILNNPHLEGNLDSRVKALGAKIYTQQYIKRMIKKENYGI
jgi:hypothetical protein